MKILLENPKEQILTSTFTMKTLSLLREEFASLPYLMSIKLLPPEKGLISKEPTLSLEKMRTENKRSYKVTWGQARKKLDVFGQCPRTVSCNAWPLKVEQHQPSQQSCQKCWPSSPPLNLLIQSARRQGLWEEGMANKVGGAQS